MAPKWKAPDMTEEQRRALWDDYANPKMHDTARDSRRLLSKMHELGETSRAAIAGSPGLII
jgi:hypothetical protein